MKKLMKGYKHARRARHSAGEPFNHRPMNVVLKRRERNGLVYDKHRRMWVKKGGR